MKKKRAVVVTTAHKGVFFGYTSTSQPKEKDSISLDKARMCVYWSADIKGVMGLASSGPSSSCKIGPAVPSVTLHSVTAVIDTTEEAVAAWEKSPWRM